MSIAKVAEISASSNESFADAVQQGITRASKTLKNIQGAWVNEHKIVVTHNKITEWRVVMKISFVLDE